VYTSETRGSDESGEGTYRVPFKTVMKVHYFFVLNVACCILWQVKDDCICSIYTFWVAKLRRWVAKSGR
jgi:hypothetical protein